MILLVYFLFSLAFGRKFEVTYLCDDGSTPLDSGCCGSEQTCPENCGFYTISNESGRRTCSCTSCSRSNDIVNGGSGSGSSGRTDRPPSGRDSMGPSGDGGRTGSRAPARPPAPRSFRIPNCEKVMGFAACQAATDMRGRKCSWEVGDVKCNEARIQPFAGYGGYPQFSNFGRMFNFDSPDMHSWNNPFTNMGYNPFFGSGSQLQFSREQLVEDVISTCNALPDYECREWTEICSFDASANLCVSNKEHFPEAVRTVSTEQEPLKLQAAHLESAPESTTPVRVLPLVGIFISSFLVTAGVAHFAFTRFSKTTSSGKLMNNC